MAKKAVVKKVAKKVTKKTIPSPKSTVKSRSNDWHIAENISVTDLVLDPENIRLPLSHKGQDAIIADLFTNENAMQILKSIHNNGFFRDELPDVILEKGKYIVIDGNRRVSALKAMIEPRLVPSFEKQISALKVGPIRKINVLVAPNRDEAIKLVASKHTDNTRRPWKTLRQAYFYKSLLDNGKTISQLKKDYPEHDIEKFIKMLEVHHVAKSFEYSSPEITAKVHDERQFPITTLERMYDDKNIQSVFGFGFDKNGKVQVQVAKKEFEKGMQKIVEDVATGVIDSRKHNTEAQRRDYVKKFPKELIPSLKKTKKELGSADFKALPAPVKSRVKIQKGLIPSYVKFTMESSSLKAIYDELRNLKVDDFPNATHDLLRSFLECALVTFFKATGEYSTKIAKGVKHNPKLSELLTFAASDACTSITDSNVKQVITQVKQNYSENYSLERMNMTNHNEDWASAPKEVRVAWGKLESLMKIILNPIPSGKK